MRLEARTHRGNEMETRIAPERLGSGAFLRRHHLKYAYVAGAMYKGIASKELVVRMGKAGLIGFLGTGGMKFDQIESDIRFIQSETQSHQVYGLNLLASPFKPDLENATVDLLLRHRVPRVEAAAFTQNYARSRALPSERAFHRPGWDDQHTAFGFGESVAPGGRRTVSEPASNSFGSATRRER